jgi:hypothetical protein
MSDVTNVILSLCYLDSQRVPSPPLELLNAWLRSKIGVELVPHNNRPKGFTADVFFGAFHDLPVRDFVQYFKGLPWRAPADAQLMVKMGHASRFEIFTAEESP